VKVKIFSFSFLSYKMLTPQEVSEAAIDAILKNKREVSMPFGVADAARFFSLLPFWYQHFHRDFIRQERNFLIAETQ
jgi:short-subunit dehydrogenase